MAFYWRDTFTGANATLLTAHTPEVGSGGYTDVGDAMAIMANQAGQESPLNNYGFRFDPGQTTFTLYVTFRAALAAQCVNRRFKFYVRYQDASNHFYAYVNFGTSDTVTTFTLHRVLATVDTTVATGTISILAATEYTMVMKVTPTTVSATIGNVLIGVDSESLATQTKCALHSHVDTNVQFAQYFDNLNVTDGALYVTNATNACPIVITTSLPNGIALIPGLTLVTISGVLGNTNANGIFAATPVTDTTFYLCGSHGNAAFIESLQSTFVIFGLPIYSVPGLPA